jgi:hypothetical protein
VCPVHAEAGDARRSEIRRNVQCRVQPTHVGARPRGRRLLQLAVTVTAAMKWVARVVSDWAVPLLGLGAASVPQGCR